MVFLLLLLIGVGAGILAGLLGVGGGIIFTPVLFYLFSTGGVEQPVLWTLGSSLFCTFAASLSSTARQMYQKNFYPAEALKVGLMGVAGTYIGKTLSLSEYYTETEFLTLFAALLLYTCYSYLTNGHRHTVAEPRQERPVHLGHAALIGGIGGIVASLAGVGGGIIIVPAMTLLFCVPFFKTVSISSAAIVIISLAAWLQLATQTPVDTGLSNYTWGYLDLGAALPLIIGTIGGAYLGARLTRLVRRRTMELLFSGLTLVVALRLLYDAWF